MSVMINGIKVFTLHLQEEKVEEHNHYRLKKILKTLPEYFTLNNLFHYLFCINPRF